MQDRKCGFSDLSSLTDEDIINFKELFFENRVSKFHRGTGKMMETLYDYIIDILNRRVPVDGTNVKVDQIINKVKLVEIPEDVIENLKQTIRFLQEVIDKTEGCKYTTEEVMQALKETEGSRPNWPD